MPKQPPKESLPSVSTRRCLEEILHHLHRDRKALAQVKTDKHYGDGVAGDKVPNVEDASEPGVLLPLEILSWKVCELSSKGRVDVKKPEHEQDPG